MAATEPREYEQTHPWLSFGSIDLQLAGAEFWMLMGEARSQVDHLALALLDPEAADELLRVYLAKGAHATTAIEGNALSEAQVAELLEGNSTPPPPSQEYLYREVTNIVAAYNRIKDYLVEGGDPALSVQLIKDWDRQVLDGSEEEGVTPGEVRTDSVVVGLYRGAPAQDCEYLLDRLCEWLNGTDFEPLSDDLRVPYALIKAAISHLYLVWIHPFDNGNGRTARLMELQILMAAGVPMPAAHLLSNHYNITRDEYYRQLQRASDTGGDVVPFLRYAIRGFIDGIRGQAALVWEQQYADRWEQFVYETFGGHTTTEAEQRRLRLVLSLSKQEGDVPRREIPSLDSALAVAYNDTQRMLSRDLNALESMGLIESTSRGRWRPRKERVLAFRSVRREARVETRTREG